MLPHITMTLILIVTLCSAFCSRKYSLKKKICKAKYPLSFFHGNLVEVPSPTMETIHQKKLILYWFLHLSGSYKRGKSLAFQLIWLWWWWWWLLCDNDYNHEYINADNIQINANNVENMYKHMKFSYKINMMTMMTTMNEWRLKKPDPFQVLDQAWISDCSQDCNIFQDDHDQHENDNDNDDKFC